MSNGAMDGHDAGGDDGESDGLLPPDKKQSANRSTMGSLPKFEAYPKRNSLSMRSSNSNRSSDGSIASRNSRNSRASRGSRTSRASRTSQGSRTSIGSHHSQASCTTIGRSTDAARASDSGVVSHHDSCGPVWRSVSPAVVDEEPGSNSGGGSFKIKVGPSNSFVRSSAADDSQSQSGGGSFKIKVGPTTTATDGGDNPKKQSRLSRLFRRGTGDRERDRERDIKRKRDQERQSIQSMASANSGLSVSRSVPCYTLHRSSLSHVASHTWHRSALSHVASHTWHRSAPPHVASHTWHRSAPHTLYRRHILPFVWLHLLPIQPITFAWFDHVVCAAIYRFFRAFSSSR
jgi:hypothetical protein